MYIYKITNLVNNKVYIGQTRTNYPLGRWSSHKNKLNNATHKNPHLLSAWKKYGANNWIFDVIDTATSINQLDKLEIHYIEMYKSTNPEFGYNVASGGTAKFTLSDEARRRIGDASKKRIHTLESREKRRRSMIGKKMPPKTKEQRLRLSDGLKAKWADPEFHKKMKLIRKKQMTDALKKRISKTKKAQFIMSGHNQAKLWPPFISPDGIIYTDIVDMNKFAKLYGLSGGSMRRVAHGIRNSHKGWKLYKPVN